MQRQKNSWVLVLGLSLGLITATGIAVAQEGGSEVPVEDPGQPSFEDGGT